MFQRMLKQNHFAWGLITPGKEFNWQRAVKSSRVLRSIYLRVFSLAVGRYTPMWVTSIYSITRKLLGISKRQGLVGLVKYCKVLYILTQQAAGGHRVNDTTGLGARVSRTSTGLPRIINKAHRASIREGNAAVLRMYLSIFGLYRVVEIPGKVKLHTITALCLYKQADHMVHLEFIPKFWSLLASLLARRRVEALPDTVAKVLGYRNERDDRPTLRIDRILPIQSSGPLSSGGMARAFTDPLWLKITDKIRARMETCTDGEGFLVGLWRGLRPPEIQLKERLNKKWTDKKNPLLPGSVGTLWFTVSHWMNSPLMPLLIEWTKIFKLDVVKTIFRTAHAVDFGKIEPWGAGIPKGTLRTGLGKLAFLEEAAGKVRVVALVDILTQSILKPLHDWIFGVLRQIPQDGTFDQTAPLELLTRKGFQYVYSYDLSAATDRLPLALQESILGWLLGDKVASLWANLLVQRVYSFHPRTAEKYGLPVTEVRYAAGQPMGAYSSWAMLALTHHFCVQLAAWRVNGGYGGWFEDYAVLGDDVVIANRPVASVYLSLMTSELRVDIQETKSLISNNGSCEFAKRTILRGNDATPISLKGFIAGLRNLPAMEGILAKLPGLREDSLPRVARSLGFGYKVTGRLQAGLSRRDRLQGLIVYLTRPGGLLARDFLSWVIQDAFNCRGAPVTYDSLQQLYRKVGEIAGETIMKALELRKETFERGSKAGGWLPTTWFPTRTLFDVYQNLVLRPIYADIVDRIYDVEALMLRWKSRTDVSEDEFIEFMKELEKIHEEVDNLPKDFKVARLVTETVPTGSKILKVWRSLRKLVVKD